MSAIRDAKLVAQRIGELNDRQMSNLKEAMEVTQGLVVNRARELVPVKTGFLQTSIQAGELKITPLFFVAEVNANAEYAEFVEFGTSRQRPQPYMAPAILEQANPFRIRVQRAVKM